MVAEDDDELRHLLARRLRRIGCEVIEARTGLELVELLAPPADGPAAARAHAELVISDIRMPGLTGLEVVSLLRSVDWAMPVILLTGFGDDAAHAEARRLGATLYDKPVDLDELIAAAAEHLGLAA
ncbi:MAG: response regulator [Myxococcales bacterium]|nr:response regulator [Myxococcales bacterium]